MLSFPYPWFQSVQLFFKRISSGIAAKFSAIGQDVTFLSDKLVGKLCKSLAISGLIVYVLYILLSNHPCCQSSNFLANLRHKWGSDPITTDSPTNLSDLVFGIAASVNTWRTKRIYIDAWWRPNITRGYLFLERTPTNFLPWPSSFPPFRVSEDISRYQPYNKHRMPHAIRMVRVIAETYREENKGVRWYVMADDDTVLFIDNLVEVLARYDHRKYFYIGMNSECVTSNIDHSFEMAFGGAGYALSYPLAEALARNLDVCIKRYPTLYGSDHILQSCVADLGVSLTHEKGFHQVSTDQMLSEFLFLWFVLMIEVIVVADWSTWWPIRSFISSPAVSFPLPPPPRCHRSPLPLHEPKWISSPPYESCKSRSISTFATDHLLSQAIQLVFLHIMGLLYPNLWEYIPSKCFRETTPNICSMEEDKDAALHVQHPVSLQNSMRGTSCFLLRIRRKNQRGTNCYNLYSKISTFVTTLSFKWQSLCWLHLKS